jgi:hypothetical protein
LGEWFVTVIKTTSGKHTKLCMKSQTIRGLVKYEKKAEMTKMDHWLPLMKSRNIQNFHFARLE